MKNLTQILDNAAQKAPNRQAFIGFSHSITYAKLRQNSISLGNYLSSNTKGTVAIMLPNLLSFPVALFATWYAGRTATLINPLYTSDELLKQCSDAQVSQIIIAKIFYKTLSPILKQTTIKQVIIVEVGDLQPPIKRLVINLISKIKSKTFALKRQPKTAYITFNSIINNPTSAPNQALSKNAIALLQYTGGTSGTLKAAELTHKNILANIDQLQQWLPAEINEKSVILTALPMYHIFALTVNCLLFISIKGSSVLVLNPKQISQLISPLKEYKIDAITGVNTLFNALISHKDFKKLDFSSMKLAIAGGMALDKKISDSWQTITGKPIIQGYGLTECSPVVSAEDAKAKQFTGSVGKPLQKTQVMVFDTKLKPMKADQIGEIGIKGPQVMGSYWQKKSLNQNVFTKDGYFLSGDLGYIDEVGQIFLIDRLKEMIITSGFNVYPRDVEQVLNQHSEVLESACIGVQNHLSGERIKAFVVKKPNSNLTKQVLIDYCKAHLAHYKIPKEIEWIKTLPKSNIGKILKRKLN